MPSARGRLQPRQADSRRKVIRQGSAQARACGWHSGVWGCKRRCASLQRDGLPVPASIVRADTSAEDPVRHQQAATACQLRGASHQKSSNRREHPRRAGQARAVISLASLT
jgi:hypothetical protein